MNQSLDGAGLSKYVPLAMIVLEDITAAFKSLRLKEFVIIVPEGFSCNSSISIDEVKDYLVKTELNWKNETVFDQKFPFGRRSHLPIVHCNYFVFEIRQ